MHCNVAFKMDQIHDSFPKSFWTNEYKKHRESTLLSLERSQCAATLPYVQMAVEHDAASAELRACRDEIAVLTMRLKQKRNQERAFLARVRDTELDHRIVLKTNAQERHVPCNTLQCRGFVTKKNPACACCLHSTCHRCHQTITIAQQATDISDEMSGDAPAPTGHVCTEDNVATVQELRRNTKQCPECCVYISKVDGCDQMFCVSCHTAFSWNTGLRIDGPIHNPHYFEVRARLGNVAHLPANPRENRCDEFPSLLDVRRAVNDGSVAQTEPGIEQTLRNALHVRGVVCTNLRALGRAYSFNTNLERRVDWMRKKLTDEQFRQHLHRNDKKARYNAELLSLFQMYTDVVGGLYQNMVVQRTVEVYGDIVKLKEYTHVHLQSIKKRYGSDCTQYDKYVAS